MINQSLKDSKITLNSDHQGHTNYMKQISAINKLHNSVLLGQNIVCNPPSKKGTIKPNIADNNTYQG